MSAVAGTALVCVRFIVRSTLLPRSWKIWFRSLGETLSIVPHVLIELEITDLDQVHTVQPEQVVDRTWRRPGDPQVGGQLFGDRLLAQHKFVLISRALSRCIAGIWCLPIQSRQVHIGSVRVRSLFWIHG